MFGAELPLVCLTVIVTVGAGLAWGGRWWDPVRRVALAGAALDAFLTVAFLIGWNYLPLRF